jgi:hypothetical protein
MKKKKVSQTYSYYPKVKLTIDDILEIYNLFKSIYEKPIIEINNYELENISEINLVKPPFELIVISGCFKSIDLTFVHIKENQIIFNLDDKDNILLEGLKSKVETVLNNRENPIKKESIIDHEKSDQDSTNNSLNQQVETNKIGFFDKSESTISHDKPNQDSTNNSLNQQVETNKIGFFERYKTIIEGLIVGIVLLVIGIIINHFFGTVK